MLTVHPATPDRRARAREHFRRENRELADFLASLEHGTIPLDGLLIAEDREVPVGLCLYVMQPDRGSFVWPPVVVDDRRAEPVADALLQELGRRLDAQHSWLGQCLLEPHDTRSAARLQRNGFQHVSDIVYLERSLAAPGNPPAQNPETIVYDPRTNAQRFARTIERTYVGTLDCTALNGLRTGADALESHRHSGVFDPARWKIFRRGGDDAGVLLLNDHPDQDAWEVVYMGVVPEARGLGLGRDMLLSGLAEARAAGRRAMLLAVDARNNYALRIYDDLKFVEIAVRSVYARLSPSRA